MSAARRTIGRLATPVGAVTAFALLGASLRLSTLDAKSFWRDEAYTVMLVRLDLGSMLGTISETEGTPPLYYVLAWLWSQVVGIDETALRSLSALIGLATIPVAFLTGRELVSRRAGVAAAGLVAVNPILVWYSQEARAYALLILLGGLSFLFFARALRDPGRPALVGWAVASSLALATHYFAFFLVGVEAAWLLIASRLRRRVLAAAAAVCVVGAALVPLLREQRGDGSQWGWIAERSLPRRLVELPGLLLVGFETPAPFLVAGVAGALAAVCLWPLARRSNGALRRAARPAAGVAVLSMAAPLVLALVGHDYFYYRNLLGAAVPLAVVLAAGVGARGSALVTAPAAGGLAVLSIGVLLATATEPKYHREEWRGVAAALGPPRTDRAVVMTPAYAPVPIAAYMPGTELMPTGGRAVGEVVLLAVTRADATALGPPVVPRRVLSAPPRSAGFRRVERRNADLFTLVRYRTRRPVLLSSRELAAHGIAGGEPTVLLQPRAPR